MQYYANFISEYTSGAISLEVTLQGLYVYISYYST